LAKLKSSDLLKSFEPAITTGLMGSYYSMAPEQWIMSEPDVRTDIYSLGIMMFQMIVGDFPFTGKSSSEFRNNHLEVEPPKFAAFGITVTPQIEKIEKVIRESLEKKPENRPQTVEEFLEKLLNEPKPNETLPSVEESISNAETHPNSFNSDLSNYEIQTPLTQRPIINSQQSYPENELTHTGFLPENFQNSGSKKNLIEIEDEKEVTPDVVKPREVTTLNSLQYIALLAIMILIILFGSSLLLLQYYYYVPQVAKNETGNVNTVNHSNLANNVNLNDESKNQGNVNKSSNIQSSTNVSNNNVANVAVTPNVLPTSTSQTNNTSRNSSQNSENLATRPTSTQTPKTVSTPKQTPIYTPTPTPVPTPTPDPLAYLIGKDCWANAQSYRAKQGPNHYSGLTGHRIKSPTYGGKSVQVFEAVKGADRQVWLHVKDDGEIVGWYPIGYFINNCGKESY
jgi:hypothetical protein